MTESLTVPGSEPPTRPNALAEIQFASMADSDVTPSEDENPEEQALHLGNVQSAIGVSIGQQQTRLAAPATPAAEKAAALMDTDDGGFFDDWESENDSSSSPPCITQSDVHDRRYGENNERQPRPDVAHQDSSTIRLPSPWRATPRKIVVEENNHRTTMRSALGSSSRRRAMSAGAKAEALKKYMSNFNFRSMPKTPSLLNFSLPNLSVPSLDHALGRSSQRKRGKTLSSSPMSSGLTQNDGSHVSRTIQGGQCSHTERVPTGRRHPSTDPIPQHPFARPEPFTSDSNPNILDFESPRSRSLRLRRSNSEGSLLVHRQMSIASSLGDDSRFEHVQEQVNSRLKAIKDSWQDANFKLPGMQALTNFSFGSRDDLLRQGRSSTLSLRSLNADRPTPSTGPSFLAPFDMPSSARSTKVLPKLKEFPASNPGASSSTSTHPHFTQALHDLTGDVVILGGYRGSILRSAEPPHRQLWAPVKVGLNIRKVDLSVGLNPEDEEKEGERIIPSGMLTHVGPVDIARRLLKRLRACDNAKNGDLRVHNYGYDWRLSPHLLSERLIKFLKTLPCNQPGVDPEKRGAIVIAHSLGGLITRHAINQCPELVAGVVYAGVPQSCVNILGPLRNGDDVLLSSRVLTAQVNFTIRTSFALLPLDGKCFIDKNTKEDYPVDFFDINTWSEYRLSPCIAPPLPAPAPPQSLRTASGLLNAVSQALPSLPGRKSSITRGKNSSTSLAQGTPAPTTSSSVPHRKDKDSEPGIQPHASPLQEAANVLRTTADKAADSSAETAGLAPQMNTKANTSTSPARRLADTSNTSSNSHPATAVTIPHAAAVEYLTRTLAEVKQFKEELAFRPEHAESNIYPPIALIYSKSTPTLYRAKVESREAIKRADAYDELAFASGDGVVLARAAMVPDGYSVVRGGIVSSDRGHVTLLGDLEAVGRCLGAVIRGRRNGIGMGRKEEKREEKGLGEAVAEGLGLA